MITVFQCIPPRNFQGSLEELKAEVPQLNVLCPWQHTGAYELALFDDGVSNLKLNWWPRTGEIRLVGDPEVRNDIQGQIQALLLELQQD